MTPDGTRAAPELATERAGAEPADAARHPGGGGVGAASVTTWIGEHVRPVSLAPDGPPLDLPASLTRAGIVGVASPVRSARESVTATHAILRSLVVRAGFRAVMIEGADAVAAQLDRYVRTGVGDPAALLSSGQGFVQFREVLGALTWMRRWTLQHPDDPVSVVHDRGERPGAAGSLREVEQLLARRDLDWHAATGERVVHWGGTAHVVAGDPRTVPPDQTHPNAGGLLRRELGAGYAVVGLTVGSGHAPFPVPPPPPDFTEHAFADLALDPDADAALLDLAEAARGPGPIREWLRRSLRTRMIGPVHHPDRDHDARVDAGPLAAAIDVILHVPRFGAATPLSRPGSRRTRALPSS